MVFVTSSELKSVASEPHREMNKVSAHDKSVGSILQRNTRQSGMCGHEMSDLCGTTQDY